MKKLFIFLLLAGSFSLRAQTSGQLFLDSLLRELPGSRPDTNKAKLLDLVSFSYSRIDPNEGLSYAAQAVRLSDSLKWKTGIAAANSDFGVNYAALSDHPRSIYYYRKAETIYEQLGMKQSVAGVLANIGLVYMSQSDYPKALEYDFKALAINEALHDDATGAIIRENIGTIYLEQKKYDKAMSYYEQALEIYRRCGDRSGEARAMGNIGIVLDAKGDYSKALEQHTHALETNQRDDNRGSVQNNLANIGIVYTHMKNFPKALENQQAALEISEDLGIQSDIAVNLGNLGETYFMIAADMTDSTGSTGKQANLERAIGYLEQAVTRCSELNFYGPLIEFTQFLSDAYSLSGNSEKALDVYRRHTQYKDSVFSQQNQVRLHNLEAQRELDLKEKEIVLRDKELEIARLNAANKRNERVIYIAGILALLTVVSIIVVRFIRRNREHRSVLSDIASIQSHELRGPVARIQGLAQLFNRENPADPVNGELIGHISKASVELDDVIRKVTTRIYDEKLQN